MTEIRLQKIAVVLATVVVITSYVGASVVIADDFSEYSNPIQVDKEHPLESQEAKESYESNKSITKNIQESNSTNINLSITISESSDNLDVDRYTIDFNKHFLKIDYNENIERSFRIYIHKTYFVPRVKQNLQSYDENVSINLERDSTQNYTVIKMHLDGKTESVFPIGKEAGLVFSMRSGVRDVVGKANPINLPDLTSNKEWTYIDSTKLSAKSGDLYVLQDNSTDFNTADIRYDRGDEDWAKMPKCGDERVTKESGICIFNRNDNGTQIKFHVIDDNPPDVKYRNADSIVADVDRMVEEIKAIPDRISFSGIFG